jgi:hypothetical protein
LWAEVGRVIARPLTETTHRFVPLRLRARWGALRWIQEIMTSGTPATAAEWLAAVASIQALNDSDQA